MSTDTNFAPVGDILRAMHEYATQAPESTEQAEGTFNLVDGLLTDAGVPAGWYESGIDNIRIIPQEGYSETTFKTATDYVRQMIEDVAMSKAGWSRSILARRLS